jgi:hypothetical protein
MPQFWSNKVRSTSALPDSDGLTGQPGGMRAYLKCRQSCHLFVLGLSPKGAIQRENDHVLALLANMRSFQPWHSHLSAKLLDGHFRPLAASSRDMRGC